jgi:hypothetical protein
MSFATAPEPRVSEDSSLAVEIEPAVAVARQRELVQRVTTIGCGDTARIGASLDSAVVVVGVGDRAAFAATELRKSLIKRG